MTVWPKISLITPSLNQGKYIGETIESVLAQNYPNLEYLVIDGGSTDNTLKILKHYQSRIKFVCEKDRGQSHAVNKGWHMSCGEIVGFINSDDRLLPDSLKLVAQTFLEHKQAKWVTGKCLMINQNGRPVRRFITAYKNYWLKHYSYTTLLVLNFISQVSTFWRKELLSDPEIGYLDETMQYSMDYDYFLKLGRKYKPIMIPKYLAEYRVHPASKGGTDHQRQFLAELAISQKYHQSGLINLLHLFHVYAAIAVYSLGKLKPYQLGD